MVSRSAHCIGVGVGAALQVSILGCSWGANVKDRHTPVTVCGRGSSRILLSQLCHTGVWGYAFVGGEDWGGQNVERGFMSECCSYRLR